MVPLSIGENLLLRFLVPLCINPMKLILLVSLFLAAPALAGQYEDIVDKAFEAFDDHDSETWV